MAKPTTYHEIAFTTAPSSTTPAWEDVTSYVQHETGVRLDKWRSEEYTECQPSRSSLLLKNIDGRFTPGYTSGAHYPNIKKGRRIRTVSTMFPNTSFETDTTGWTGANATLARVATPVRSGSGAMRLTATAGADMSADTPSGTSGVAVVAGAAYVLCGWFRTAVTSRSCKMRADWYTAAGAFISSSDTGTVTDLTTGYTAAEVRVTAPPAAAFARLRAMVTAPAAAEVHYVDFALLGSARFSGYVDDWVVTWPGAVPTFATCSVTASSRMARLGSGGNLRSIVEEEILLDSPAAYYTLGEPADSPSAADSSGNSVESLLMVGTGAAVVFGTATGPGTDGLTAATFNAGKVLQNSAVLDPDGNAWVSCFFVRSTSVTTLLELVRAGDGTASISVSLDSDGFGGGIVRAAAQASGGPVVSALSTETTAATFHDGLVHHALALVSGGVLSVYVDGVLRGDTVDASLSPFTAALPAGMRVGGDPLGAPFSGTIAHAAFGASSITAARIAAHAAVGLNTYQGETPAARLARYAAFAKVPAAETSFETGDLPGLAHIDTTDKTALQVMREVETAEGGVLFDAGDGTLTCHDRSHRYGAVSAFTVTASKVVTPLAPVLDAQLMVNDMSATGSTGITARFIDAASIADYDYYRQTLDLATYNADEPLLHASWRVGRYSTPTVRVPSVEIHLNKTDAALTAAILAAEVGTKFTLSGLPANAPATSMDLFVEGIEEFIDAAEHLIILRTSAASVFDVWILGDATYGVLNSTTRLAY